MGPLLKLKCAHSPLNLRIFIFNKCPTYAHDGENAKFITNSQETDYRVAKKQKYNEEQESINIDSAVEKPVKIQTISLGQLALWLERLTNGRDQSPAGTELDNLTKSGYPEVRSSTLVTRT